MEVTSFSKSGEHEIRNRKEENNMDENTKNALRPAVCFYPGKFDREKTFIGEDKPIYRMAGERKMMRSMPGIWRS